MWTRVCEIYIASWELEAKLLNNQQEKWQKSSHDKNEKEYLSCAICVFLVAAAFLMSSEIY